MIKTDKLDGRALRGLLIGLGIVVCLGAVGYSFFIIQQESGQEGEHRQVAEELGDLARQVADSARETEQGREEYFADLARQVEAFDAQLARIRVPELSDQVSLVDIDVIAFIAAEDDLVSGQVVLLVLAVANTGFGDFRGRVSANRGRVGGE